MDQELRVVLEEMEARMEARAEAREARLEARMDERFAQVDGRFAQLEARMDGRFEKVDGRFAQVDGRFEKVEAEGRHTRILVEGLHSEIRMVAEGVAGVSERLDAFQKETAKKFDEVNATMSLHYKNLDGRLQRVEGEVKSLDRRVTVLERKAGR